MKDFQIKQAPMKSRFKYHMKRKGKSVWLWRDGRYAADSIYFGSDDPNHKSEGMGGRTLTFELVDGGSIDLNGPWHTSSDSLFGATGIDIRDKHATFVVVSSSHQWSQHVQIMKDVLYQDDCWMESEFDRGKKIAQTIANDLCITVQLYAQSSGGSSRGQVSPKEAV